MARKRTKTLKAALPEMLLAILREQYVSVAATYNRVPEWRDRGLEQP